MLDRRRYVSEMIDLLRTPHSSYIQQSEIFPVALSFSEYEKRTLVRVFQTLLDGRTLDADERKLLTLLTTVRFRSAFFVEFYNVCCNVYADGMFALPTPFIRNDGKISVYIHDTEVKSYHFNNNGSYYTPSIWNVASDVGDTESMLRALCSYSLHIAPDINSTSKANILRFIAMLLRVVIQRELCGDLSKAPRLVGKPYASSLVVEATKTIRQIISTTDSKLCTALLNATQDNVTSRQLCGVYESVMPVSFFVVGEKEIEGEEPIDFPIDEDEMGEDLENGVPSIEEEDDSSTGATVPPGEEIVSELDKETAVPSKQILFAIKAPNTTTTTSYLTTVLAAKTLKAVLETKTDLSSIDRRFINEVLNSWIYRLTTESILSIVKHYAKIVEIKTMD
jgi:hypothetical protein